MARKRKKQNYLTPTLFEWEDDLPEDSNSTADSTKITLQTIDLLVGSELSFEGDLSADSDFPVKEMPESPAVSGSDQANLTASLQNTPKTDGEGDEESHISLEWLFKSMFPKGRLDLEDGYRDFFGLEIGSDAMGKQIFGVSKSPLSIHFPPRTVFKHPDDAFVLRILPDYAAADLPEIKAIEENAIFGNPDQNPDAKSSALQNGSFHPQEILWVVHTDSFRSEDTASFRLENDASFELADSDPSRAEMDSAKAASSPSSKTINFQSSKDPSLEEMLMDADVYIDGKPEKLSGHSLQDMLAEAFRMQLEHLYPYRSWIFKKTKDTREIYQTMQALSSSGLLFEADENNPKARDAILNWVVEKARKHQLLPFSSLLHHFKEAPYGWRDLDIVGLIGALFASRQIRLTDNGDPILILEKSLPGRLLNKRQSGKILVQPSMECTPAMRKEAMLFIQSWLGKKDSGFPAGHAETVIQKLTELWKYYASLLALYKEHAYPGKDILQQARDLVTYLIGFQNQPEALYAAIYHNRSAIQKIQSDLIPVETFFADSRSLFDQAAALVETLRQESRHLDQNHAYTSALILVKEILEDPAPYEKMDRLQRASDHLQSVWQQAFEAQKKQTLSYMESSLKKSKEMASQIEGTSSAALETISFLEDLIQNAKDKKTIGELVQAHKTADSFVRRQFPTLERILASQLRRKQKEQQSISSRPSQPDQQNNTISKPADSKSCASDLQDSAAQKEADLPRKASAPNKPDQTSLQTNQPGSLQKKPVSLENNLPASPLLNEEPSDHPEAGTASTAPTVKKLFRYTLFKNATLHTQQEVEDYVTQIKNKLLKELEEHDTIVIE